MKKLLLFCLLIFAVLQVQAQAIHYLSQQQQMDFYQAQIDSAQNERNASKTASIYGNIVAICRETPIFEELLPENLYHYGLWSTYAGNHIIIKSCSNQPTSR